MSKKIEVIASPGVTITKPFTHTTNNPPKPMPPTPKSSRPR